MSDGSLATPVTTAEELVILAFRRDTRRRQLRWWSSSGSLSAAVNAALIIDAVRAGQLSVVRQPTKKSAGNFFGLRVLNAHPTDSAVVDELLSAVADPKHADRALSWWLSRSSPDDVIRQTLIARGLYVESQRGVGPFLGHYRFEPVDVAFDEAIRRRFEATFLGGQTPSERDWYIAAILSYGLIWQNYSPLKGRNEREKFEARMERIALRPGPLGSDGLPVRAVLAALSALITFSTDH